MPKSHSNGAGKVPFDLMWGSKTGTPPRKKKTKDKKMKIPLHSTKKDAILSTELKK